MEIMENLYPLMSEKELGDKARNFCRELFKALHNQPSSLPSILNPIHRIEPTSGMGVALSIGGTNGYVSLFRISKKGSISFINREFFILPPDTTKDLLFRLMAEKLILVSKKIKNGPLPVGIGFAYPLKPLLHHGFIDGKLLSMSKGREIDGLVGNRVGQEFHRYLIKKHGIDTTVAVANDAICLLLGGDGTDLAGVVGTGLNFAYWEKRARVAPLKLVDLEGFGQHEVAINIESAEFNGITASKLGIIVDKESDKRSEALAEKEVAGAYLYQIFNAGKKEIVGDSFPNLSSTDQINDLTTGAFWFPKRVNAQMQNRARLFAERIFHRSAQIVAIELCGILIKIGKTEGLVPVVMEGGIFWKAKNYSSLVNLYVNQILPDVIPSFARLFGSSRRGIAILARSRTR